MMSFKKDGETKVFVSKSSDVNKSASEEERVRYTVDDLVKDSAVTLDRSKEGEEAVSI